MAQSGPAVGPMSMALWVLSDDSVLGADQAIGVTSLCSKDITWPKDTEATEGSDVVLNCISLSERSFEWHHLPCDYSSTEISHKDGACLNGYCARGYSMVNNTPGEYSLLISNVSIEDAGNHRCVLSSDQRGAELNVLVLYPSKETCTSELPTDGIIGHNHWQLEPDRITSSCNLKYVGNLKAYLEWIQTAGSHVDFYVDNKTSYGTIKGTLIIEDRQLQDATFVCRIRYLNSNLTSRFNYIFPIKTIPLRLRSVTADSELGLRQINCSSDLPHKCSYRWTHEGIEVSSSQTLNLIGPKVGKYTCHATCIVRGRSCTFTSYEVTYKQNATDHVPENNPELPQAETSNTGMIVGIVVALGVFVAVVTGVVIYLKIRRRACFSKTFSAIRDKGDDQDERPATQKLFPPPRQDENKGEEGNKLLEKTVDGAPLGNIPVNDLVLRYNDLSEVNMADINKASSDYNIKIRKTPQSSSNEIGNTAGHHEVVTNGDHHTDTDKTDLMV